MQFMIFCCFDESQWDGLPEPERDRIMRDYGAWIAENVKSGKYRIGAKLRPTSAATSIRFRNGRPAIVDGPFAETKEQVGGFHLIECADLDEALAIANRIPTLPGGGALEVRPVEELIRP